MNEGIPTGLPHEWQITIEMLLGSVGLTVFLLFLVRIYIDENRQMIERDRERMDRILERELFPEEYEARHRALEATLQQEAEGKDE